MKSIKRTIFAYEIGKAKRDVSNTEKCIDTILKMLSEKKKTVGERIRNPSKEDNEAHFISNFNIDGSNNILFGTVIKMGIGQNRNILEKHFKQEIVTLSEIEVDTKNAVKGYEKDVFYFCMHNDYLVMCGKKQDTMKPFEIYINWFLDTMYEPYTIVPIVRNTERIKKSPFSSISQITIDDNNGHNIKRNEKTKTIIEDLKENLFPDLIDNYDELNKTDVSNIISAKIILTIKHGDKNYNDLRNTMRLVDNAEDVYVKTKNGENTRLSEFEERKQIKVKATDSGRIDEDDLKMQMIEYIKDLKK